MVHGIEYVNWPRLLPLNDIIYYDGPGFRSGHKGKGFGISALDPEKLSRSARAPLTKLPQLHQRVASKLDEIEMGTVRKVD